MSEEPVTNLGALAERLDRAASRPEEAARAFSRVTSFVLRSVGWRPALEGVATGRLVAFLRGEKLNPAPEATERGAVLEQLRAEAEAELASNIGAIERACAVAGRASFSHVVWLSRVLRFVARVEGAGRLLATDERQAARIGASEGPLLAPLRRAGASDAGPPEAEGVEAALVELELAAIDHVIDTANAEGAFLSRRRRLLEAARRLLLDVSAAHTLERPAVEGRLSELATEIANLDRLEAAGLSPDVALAHQARGALRRGDRGRLVSALVALDALALSSGAFRQAERASALLDALQRAGVYDRGARSASLTRSAEELLGERAVRAVHVARAEAVERFGKMTPASAEERELCRVARVYFTPGGSGEVLRLAVLADGFFDVGGALSPVRFTEVETRVRLVSHPTDDLVLAPARSVDDVRDAVVTDPRALLLDLAAGRLLARKYVLSEHLPRTTTKLVGEVRVYLLDGSGSMVTDGSDGARARMRDAILLAELATVLRRFEQGDRFTRVRLLYQFFTAELHPRREVVTPGHALESMAEVAATPRLGGTDIERALLASFELIREARQKDEALARAQIVLVTDGQAPVNEERIRAAREQVGELPVSFSVIALGEENPALRALCARQRAQGERSFYHFVSDAELLARSGRGGLLPAIHALGEGPLDEALAAELRGALDELADDRGAPEEVARVRAELREGPFAREEALARDAASLGKRFDRWFPNLLAPSAAAGGVAVAAAEVPAAVSALAALAEVVGEFGGAPLARQADAIELFERLLPDAGLSPLRYLALLEEGAPHLVGAVRAVRVAAGAPSA